MSELMLDVGQANELKMALRRAGATSEEVKRMGEGDFMSQVVGLLRGTHELVSHMKAARLRARNLYQHEGVWYVTVTSKGWAGHNWIGWFMERGILIPQDVSEFLLSPKFVPTKDVTTRLAIVRGKYYPGGFSRGTCREMEQDIDRLGLNQVNTEVACLLCLLFSGPEFLELGFDHWFIMHEPMRSLVDGGPVRLMISTHPANKNFGLLLRTVRGKLAGWGEEAGYVYALRH